MIASNYYTEEQTKVKETIHEHIDRCIIDGQEEYHLILTNQMYFRLFNSKKMSICSDSYGFSHYFEAFSFW